MPTLLLQKYAELMPGFERNDSKLDIYVAHYRFVKKYIKPELQLQNINMKLNKRINFEITCREIQTDLRNFLHKLQSYEYYIVGSCLEFSNLLKYTYFSLTVDEYVAWLDILIQLYEVPRVFTPYPGLYNKQIIKNPYSIYWQIITDNLPRFTAPEVTGFIEKYYKFLDWSHSFVYYNLSEHFLRTHYEELIPILNWYYVARYTSLTWQFRNTLLNDVRIKIYFTYN